MGTVIKLRCPYCGDDQWFDIGAWQTEPNIFGAVSLMCRTCYHLYISALSNAILISEVEVKT